MGKKLIKQKTQVTVNVSLAVAWGSKIRTQALFKKVV